MEAKANLEFKLPEQEHSFKLAVSAEKLAYTLEKVREELRAKYKYSQETGSWVEAYDLFNSLCNQTGASGIIEENYY